MQFRPRAIIPEVVLFLGLISFFIGGIQESSLLLTLAPFSLAFYFFQDKERQKTITNEQIKELTEVIKAYTEGTNNTLKKTLLELEELRSQVSKQSLIQGFNPQRGL